MPTPAEDPHHADPEEQSSTDPDEEHQLQLQFFAVLDGYARNPPERVYWRDAVKIRLKHALSTAALWSVHMRRVTPATVHHVALAVYYYANSAGIIRMSQATMADDCEIDSKTFNRAIIVLKRLGLLRSFQTSRRAPHVLAMNIGGLTWTAAREQARERRRLARAKNLALDFESPSGGVRPPLGDSSGGVRPPLRAVRTGLYTTTTREAPRPEATDAQLAFAADLGIDPAGKDLVELGAEIEQARANRAELRDVAKRARPAAARNRQQVSSIERRRLAEARRWGSRHSERRPEDPPPPAETEAEAAERLRRGLKNAEAKGYRRVADDPDVLIGPGGRRIWCPALAQLDGRAPIQTT